MSSTGYRGWEACRKETQTSLYKHKKPHWVCPYWYKTIQLSIIKFCLGSTRHLYIYIYIYVYIYYVPDSMYTYTMYLVFVWPSCIRATAMRLFSCAELHSYNRHVAELPSCNSLSSPVSLTFFFWIISARGLLCLRFAFAMPSASEALWYVDHEYIDAVPEVGPLDSPRSSLVLIIGIG